MILTIFSKQREFNMQKVFLFSLFCLFAISSSLMAEEITGLWKTVDEKTGKEQSIVAIYEYKGKYYGRLIATFDENGKIEDSIYSPKERAPGVEGNPYYSGLDIIWDLQKGGSRYTDGEILDPEKGKVYDAEAWIKDGKLIVRGEILFIGRNQEWPPAKDSDFPPDFKKPDFTKFVPSIPKVKK